MKKIIASIIILAGLVACSDQNKITSGKVVFKSEDGKVQVYQEEVDFLINQAVDPEMLKQIPKDQLEAQKKLIIKQLAFQKAIAMTPDAEKLKSSKDYKYAMSMQADSTLMSVYLKDKTKDIKVTDEEIKKAYDENKEAYTQQANAAELNLIYVPYKSDEDKANADKILAEVKQNKDKFGELAKKYSIDKTSAANGGATGPVPLDQLSPEFTPIKDAALNGTVGEVYSSLAILSNGTAVIVKIDKRQKKGEVIKFEDVKAGIAMQLKQKKVAEAQEKIVKEITDKYKLDSIAK